MQFCFKNILTAGGPVAVSSARPFMADVKIKTTAIGRMEFIIGIHDNLSGEMNVCPSAAGTNCLNEEDRNDLAG